VERNGDRRWHGIETDRKSNEKHQEMLKKRMQRPLQALELPNLGKKKQEKDFWGH